jgi:hypothetical protein
MGTKVDRAAAVGWVGARGVDSRGNFALGSATLPLRGAKPGTRAVKGVRRVAGAQGPAAGDGGRRVEWEEV